MAPDATETSGGPFPGVVGRALVVVALLGVVVLAGPRPRFGAARAEPEIGSDVDAFLADREAGVPNLRPGDSKGVVWADPDAPARTALSFVYLHGFSADRHEVEPLVSDLARALDANAFFARLRGHGRDGPAMAEATTEAWTADAVEAMEIGRRIGERVVLLGTSTGGTLALWAAAREGVQDDLAALVLISPNLGLRDAAAGLLRWPWGGLVARLVVGPERCFEPDNARQERHWTTCYPTRALLPMIALVDHVRRMDLGRVRVPTLLVYSPDDAVVDPDEAMRVLAGLGSGPPTMLAIEDAGDPASHVLAGDIMSPGTTLRIREAILRFIRTRLRR